VTLPNNKGMNIANDVDIGNTQTHTSFRSIRVEQASPNETTMVVVSPIRSQTIHTLSKTWMDQRARPGVCVREREI
jgi:hypothetical protein